MTALPSADLAAYLAAVRGVPGYSYVASPYSKYLTGIEAAFVDVCRITAALLRMGIPVFSPIAHTHPLAIHGNISPLDHTIWLPADEPLMDAAHGLLVAQMVGWDDSYGVGVEINRFKAAGKPIVYLDPRTLERRVARERDGEPAP
jgi:hypothetical protein